MEPPRALFVCLCRGARRVQLLAVFPLGCHTVLDTFSNHAFTAGAIPLYICLFSLSLFISLVCPFLFIYPLCPIRDDRVRLLLVWTLARACCRQTLGVKRFA